jgi:hypothetical protein
MCTKFLLECLKEKDHSDDIIQENSIKMGYRQTGSQNVNLIHLAQDRDKQ